MKKQFNSGRILLYFIVLLTFGLAQACESSETNDTPTPKETPTPLLPSEVAQAGRVIDLDVNLNVLAPDSTIYRAHFTYGDSSLVDSLDLVLIYRRTSVVVEDTVTNVGVPFWSLLPQTLILTQGPLLYNFSYSTTRFFIFARAQYSLGSLTNFTQNQVFRLVIIPGEELFPARTSGQQVDYNNYEEVIRHFGIPDRAVPVYKINESGRAVKL